MRKWLMFLGMVVALFACDNKRIESLEEGISTEAEVRARFGAPEKIWDGTGGTRIFEYNRQPEGSTNYMISIGADGKMQSLRQVLTPQNFAKITSGMMMEDVRKMLGKPAKIQSYALKQETHYDWRWVENGTQVKIFTAVFNPDMRVVNTFSVDDVKQQGQ